VIKGVRRLNDIRTQHGKTWDLTINFILMKSNLHEAAAFVDLARSLDVAFRFSAIIGTWHGESFYDDPAEVERARRIVGDLESQIGPDDAAGREHRLRSVRAYIDHEAEASASGSGDESCPDNASPAASAFGRPTAKFPDIAEKSAESRRVESGRG
jgi:molybdenum cofactor biosynthesis enzyme MoaA